MNTVSVMALNGFSMSVLYSSLLCKEGRVSLPPLVSFDEEWGKADNYQILDEEYTLPYEIKIVYHSFYTKKYYYLNEKCPIVTLDVPFINVENLTIGISPVGEVAVWCLADNKSVIFAQYHAMELDEAVLPVAMSQFLQETYSLVSNMVGLHKIVSIESYMKQFTYRYVVKFGKWNGKEKQWEEYGEKDRLPEFGWIEEALFDGTHDKLRDGGLMRYHEAGKPKKLAVSWHIGKAEYSAYFWFEDEGIREMFDRFYGVHPDTKTDFIIRIDAERRKYELALYRYGLKEPQVIPEDVYQLLVFKNKFEDYRSDNYNQERGAWIW